MSGRLDWTEFWFSSAGRQSRASFMAASAVLIFAAWLCEAVAPNVVVLLVVYPFLLFCGAAVTSKRLHDRGRSGWWALIVLLALIAVWNASQSFLKFPAWLVLVWAVVELCAMPGEQGANRFGPNPLRPAAA
jgi:uncharacterized membrane protein YhaH (DUF805 family)